MIKLEYKLDPVLPSFLNRMYESRRLGIQKSRKGLKRFYISDYMYRQIKDSMPEAPPKNTELTIYNIPVTSVRDVEPEYLDFSIDWT